MAYWVQKAANDNNMAGFKEYRCDDRSDIDKLPRYKIEGEKQEGDYASSYPCAYGSECFCISDSSVWVLQKDTNTWIEV